MIISWQLNLYRIEFSSGSQCKLFIIIFLAGYPNPLPLYNIISLSHYYLLIHLSSMYYTELSSLLFYSLFIFVCKLHSTFYLTFDSTYFAFPLLYTSNCVKTNQIRYSWHQIYSNALTFSHWLLYSEQVVQHWVLC